MLSTNMGLSKNLANYITNGFNCHYCNNPLVKDPPKAEQWRMATRDHKIPKVRGGSDRKTNIVLSCKRCNGFKGDMTDDEFLEFKKTGYLPTSYIRYLEDRLCKQMGLKR